MNVFGLISKTGKVPIQPSQLNKIACPKIGYRRAITRTNLSGELQQKQDESKNVLRDLFENAKGFLVTYVSNARGNMVQTQNARMCH